MTRLGPLTSMALGRSPYEDVVYGDGEGDPHAPLQMYDERGRPVNPETKRANRDIIRAHNEVMLAIGVVESENTADDLRAEHQRRGAHEHHDDAIGRNIEWVAQACELGGVWGLGAMRQRILLYKRYSHVPFLRLVHVERQTQSLTSLWFHGLPAFVVADALDLPWFADNIMQSTLAKIAFAYVQTSLKLWVFLQRTCLLPASASPWLPSWRFFLPFSSSSVITPCPFPSSPNVRTVAAWLGSVALSTAPFVAFYIVNGVCQAVTEVLYEELYDWLPNPSSSDSTYNRLQSSGVLVQRASDDRETDTPRAQAHPGQNPSPVLADPVPNANVWDRSQTNDQPHEADADRGQAPDGHTTTAPPARPENTPSAPSRPRSHPRRSHAPNTEDFSSEDEATEEIVSATLISFDVENNPENPDPSHDGNLPSGVWSAELRPNLVSDPLGDQHSADGPGSLRRHPRPRMYRDNALTRLPASIAAGLVARRASSLLLAPLEAASLRQVAWLWCRARGLPVAGLWEPAWLWPLAVRRGGRFFGWGLGLGGGLARGAAASLVGVETAHFLLDACLWGLVPLVVARCLVSDEAWEKRHKAAERGQLAPPQQQMDGNGDGVGGVQMSAGSGG